jgi:predicted site-specific integrase-resolvase
LIGWSAGLIEDRRVMGLVTAKTVSQQYGIPLPTVYYYVRKNIIPSLRLGGRLKFDPEKIEKILKLGENDCARTWQSI